jgi:hypothetical protein
MPASPYSSHVCWIRKTLDNYFHKISIEKAIKEKESMHCFAIKIVRERVQWKTYYTEDPWCTQVYSSKETAVQEKP